MIPPVRIVLFGPPAVGKGTLGAALSHQLGIPHLAIGELIRDEIRARSALGCAIEQPIADGLLLDDQTIAMIVEPRLSGGFILDGYPRTLGQARRFNDLLNKSKGRIDAYFNLEARRATLLRRAATRYEAQGRPEDAPAIAERRLAVFQRETAPAIELYKNRHTLRRLDASRPMALVLEQALRCLENLGVVSETSLSQHTA